MNPFEKQLQLGRELFELNAAALRQMVELDADSFRTMVETNQSFFARLPEVKDLPGLVSLQREYGETVWNGAQEALKARGDILRESMGKAGELVRGAFDAATETDGPKQEAA